MELVVLLSTYFAPDLTKLGADEWRVREAEHARLDNPFSALLLPVRHDDPEVNYRVQAIRTKNMRFLNPVYVESVTYHADFARWVGVYLVTGRSLLDDYDVYADIHQNREKAAAVFAAWPPDQWDGGGFLRGSILPHEYEVWREYRDYHLNRPPMPREVVP